MTAATTGGGVYASGFDVVLFAPEIPQNTGNIGRLCVSTNSRLHLIEPLGFSLEDKYLRRAGLDYWPKLDCAVHSGWDEFMGFMERRRGVRVPHADLHFFSTKGTSGIWDGVFESSSILVFGNEGSGLPSAMHEQFAGRFLLIPMPGDFHRSLNVANAAAIVIYEGIRQLSAKNL